MSLLEKHLICHTSKVLAFLESKSAHSSKAKRSGQNGCGYLCLHSNAELLAHRLQSSYKFWRDRPCVEPNQSESKQEVG